MSLRIRSTIIRFSARSLALTSSAARNARSAAGSLLRGLVPLIGLVSISPVDSSRKNCSGEALSSANDPQLMNAPNGDGLVARSRL